MAEVRFVDVSTPYLCLNLHLAVVHPSHDFGTPYWCNDKDCEWDWRKKRHKAVTITTSTSWEHPVKTEPGEHRRD
jgi:hypothetical protein